MGTAMLNRFRKIKLATKFTLLLSLVFIGAIALSGFILSRALEQKAEAEIVYRSQVLVETMDSMRNFTNTHVTPLLMPMVENQPTFVPEAIPSYAAREVFENLRKNEEYKDYFYKDAVLNPTNLRNKADTFETELVERFQKESGLTNISGFRDSFGEKLFYSARPFKVKKASCLRCHSTPEVAPKSHIASYGSENGFGWNLKDVLGTQIIYVPASKVLEGARQASFQFISIVTGIFAFVILLINYLLRRNVLQPIKPMAQLAQKISMDEITAEEAEAFEREKLTPIAKRNDELGQLGRLFQRMVHEIYAREQQLRQQVQKLRLEIDEAKRARQVAEIEESETFQKLQEEAQAMRSIRNAEKNSDHE
jgi:methyl-accepting chemotaxis protein